MAAFFDVHLENVAKVVHRGTGSAEHALLLYGGGFRVALGDNDAAKSRTIFAGNFLPSGLTLVRPEIHLASFIARLKKNAPAVIGHADIAELRPTIRLDADCGAEVDVVVVALGRAHVVPPAHVGRLPVFERALEDAIATEVDVVGNFFRVVDHGELLSESNRRSDRSD